MKLMPPPGPERRRAFVLLAITVVALAYFAWRLFGSLPTETTAVTSNSKTTEAGRIAQKGALPEPLNLAQLEPVPEEPKTSRNPFRFGVPPAPPAPPPKPVAFVPPPVVQAAPPLPPPTVPLKLAAIMELAPGKRVAYLSDGQGGQFKGAKGEIVDGRYRVLEVGEKSAVVAFLDGTGQKTLYVGQ